jgi:site-specific recombinase XerC
MLPCDQIGKGEPRMEAIEGVAVAGVGIRLLVHRRNLLDFSLLGNLTAPGNDLRCIQKNLRHASIETTAIYLHAKDDARHAETTAKHPATSKAIPQERR